MCSVQQVQATEHNTEETQQESQGNSTQGEFKKAKNFLFSKLKNLKSKIFTNKKGNDQTISQKIQKIDNEVILNNEILNKK